MSGVLSFIAIFLSSPAIILGAVAGVALVALRRPFSEVITGVLEIMFGFLILLAGAGVIVSALLPFGTMFTSVFGMDGIIAEDNSLVAAVQDVLGRETAMILALGFLVNVIIARLTPWKYVFLTGHMMFSFAGTMAITPNPWWASPSTASKACGSRRQTPSWSSSRLGRRSAVRRLMGGEDTRRRP